jgi:hypothetical protein
VQILRQLPITRARMVRDIVANDAATGFDSRRPLQFAPADGTGRRPSKPTMLVRVQLGAPYPRRWSGGGFPKSARVGSSPTVGAISGQ